MTDPLIVMAARVFIGICAGGFVAFVAVAFGYDPKPWHIRALLGAAVAVFAIGLVLTFIKRPRP